MATVVPVTATETPTDATISVDEGRAMLDRYAQMYLGLSGEEFVRRYDAGELGSVDDNPRLAHLALLLPFGR